MAQNIKLIFYIHHFSLSLSSFPLTISLQNSIRHNLSLHNRFMRVQNEGTGKSSWWMLNPDAKPGKSVRRRAASMETSKFEKRRGRVKKRVEQMRNGVLTSKIQLRSRLLSRPKAFYFFKMWLASWMMSIHRLEAASARAWISFPKVLCTGIYRLDDLKFQK